MKSDKKINIDSLVERHDKKVLNLTFQLTLKREIDPNGFNNYKRKNVLDKIDINMLIADLMNSAEYKRTFAQENSNQLFPSLLIQQLGIDGKLVYNYLYGNRH